MAVLAAHPRVRYDYDILETFEGGLMLTGAEVKSIRKGHANLKGAFMTIQNGQLYLKNAHVGAYAPAGHSDTYKPNRDRKVLIHKRELKRMIGKHEAEGLTIVPISVYTKGDLLKLEFALARGKKKYEKRETIKKRQLDREAREVMKVSKS